VLAEGGLRTNTSNVCRQHSNVCYVVAMEGNRYQLENYLIEKIELPLENYLIEKIELPLC